MTTTIRQAGPHDIATIQALRRDRTAWLLERGSDQWSSHAASLTMNEFTQRIATSITAGHTWVAEHHRQVVGTITIDDHADPGLWTDHELNTAAIIHYMIVDQKYAHHGIGAILLAHAERHATEHDRNWLRLDAWTTNTDLHTYYQKAGFQLVRIADTDLPSAALFEKRIRHPDLQTEFTNA